jgi:hypothetical protein
VNDPWALETVLIVVPAGGKYGQWVCPCGEAALWNLDTGSGWCNHCALSLIGTGAPRPAFGAASGGAVLVRAQIDSLPEWVHDQAEGGRHDQR